jgi:hypothetical protein
MATPLGVLDPHLTESLRKFWLRPAVELRLEPIEKGVQPRQKSRGGLTRDPPVRHPYVR